VEELLAARDVELVLNLTPAQAHGEITRRALAAGKHVWSEKPLAATFAEARELAAVARREDALLACAPDTFLGASLQTARRLVDDGALGTIVGASCSFVTPGSELWHHNPEILFGKGAGPIYDEGVYFLTALVALLGPIAAVTAQARTVRRERTIAQGPRAGERFVAEMPTHYVATLAFRSGALATMTMSFEVRTTTQPPLELYGTDGSLRLPFPGFYDGPVRLGRVHDTPWQEIAPEGRFLGRVRGPGVEDLARAIRERREPRCSAALALHVLEAMELLHRSTETAMRERLTTQVERPAPL
jgi:predicted dehydrogenase